MAYFSVVNNLSMYYASAPITADVSLSQWNRTFYDVDASAGNILITLPNVPDPSNLLQSGSLMFRRTDSTSNTVNLRYTFNGLTYYLYEIKADVSYTHWIMSINDPAFNDQLQITKLSATEFLKLSGGTMLGTLTLNADPSNPLEAATKQYVDNHIPAGSSFVLSGDVVSTAPVSGVAASTVNFVGGKTAAAVAQSVTDTVAATSANTVSTIVKRDSSGNFAANNITAAIVSLGAAATLSSQAPTWGQVQAYVSLSRVNIKSVVTVANSNYNLASNLIGTVINGRTLANGDRVAFIGQSTAVDNGVYSIASGGATRTSDCAAGVDGNGFVFGVLYGTFANYFYRISPSGANTTAIFGTDVNVYDVYFITQNLVADGTTISLTGNTLAVAANGVGTTQLAPYSAGNRIMGTNSSTKKPEETSIASDKLSAAMVSTQSYVQVSNFGSDTLGNGYLVPYATLSTALSNTTGAGVIKCLGGYGATGAFTQSQDNQQIEGFGADGSQVSNITGSITAPSGRTRLKIKDFQLIGNSANPIPYIAASGNLGRNYFKNVSFIPYTTSPSININVAITNWHEFDDCDFTNAVNIGGAVGTGEAYTFRGCRGVIYLYLTKNVPVTFVDCDAVFVMSHTAGQILVYGRTTVNVASTATLVSGALIYLENCTTWNSQTQSYGSIVSVCTTQLNNVTRLAANDSIAALTLNKTAVTPSSAAANYYVSGISADGVLQTSLLPTAPTKDTGVDTAVTITNANSPYPVTLSQTIINADASSGSVIITLPPISAVSTSLLGKRYTIHRTDVINGNSVIIQCNSGTSDSFQRTPVGFTQYFLGTAGSIELVAVTKSGGNVWVIENSSQSLYQGIPFDNMLTADTVLTYHGSLFTVYANSNINITLPLATYGVGSTKIVRIDANTQYNVNLVAPSGHTINGTSNVPLYINGTATARTISYGNTALVAELAQSSSSGVSLASMCQIRCIPSQEITTTTTAISFASSSTGFVKYDPTGLHSGTINPSRITIQVAGIYKVDGGYYAGVPASANYIECSIYKNGVQYEVNYVATGGVTAGSGRVSTLVSCVAGDYLELRISTSSGGVGLSYAYFDVQLGQGTPSNLPSLGSAGQVLTVNGSGSGLQYSTIANTSVTGSVLALRQSTGQTINNTTGTIATFDTTDTELGIRPSNVGLTVTGNNTFTNNTGSAMTITVSFQIQWLSNSGGQRYAWIQRNSTANRVGMVTSVPWSGGDGTVQSSSATFSLDNGDGFSIYVYQNSGSAMVINGSGVGLGTGYAGRLQITRLI